MQAIFNKKEARDTCFDEVLDILQEKLGKARQSSPPGVFVPDFQLSSDYEVEVAANQGKFAFTVRLCLC